VWGHSACLGDQYQYWIAANRIDIMGKMMHWTMHRSEKNWWNPHDWNAVVRRFSNVPQA
jgi:hypothetical protein